MTGALPKSVRTKGEQGPPLGGLDGSRGKKDKEKNKGQEKKKKDLHASIHRDEYL